MPPHIIFILADDLGWNDVSFHGSRQIPTPNIDALAAHGVILERHYATPVCSPSRAAFMTARYPSRVDMDYVALSFASEAALPLRFEVLPQWLKRLGYSTHMIGKADDDIILDYPVYEPSSSEQLTDAPDSN
nr:arylsulfatase B-like [Rhipicephalus microplus]